jgi:outer membrane lipoprotein carrier protein
MRISPFFRFTALLLIMLVISPPPLIAAAAAEDPQLVARKLQAVYDDTTGLVADFRQHTAMPMNRHEQSGSGTVVFLKPGHMRWDYYTPDRQVMISDGKTITMYFEKTKQMIVTAAKEYLQSDVTYSFFSGRGNILKDFTISAADDLQGKTKDSQVIQLVPKEANPRISRLYVWVATDTSMITRIRMVDYFDTITDFFFDHIKRVRSEDTKGPVFDPQLFTFNPPPGTEIIYQ